MYNYENLKEKHGNDVPQIIDSPILVFDYFTLSEVFCSLGAMLFFGVILYSIPLTFISIFSILVIIPRIRKKNKRGIFFHWPYRKFYMNLPGLINPRGRKKYSD